MNKKLNISIFIELVSIIFISPIIECFSELAHVPNSTTLSFGIQ